jgi:hypothetical protein
VRAADRGHAGAVLATGGALATRIRPERGHDHVHGFPGTAVGTARDVALLIARIGLGVLMVAHAWLEYDFAGRSRLRPVRAEPPDPAPRSTVIAASVAVRFVDHRERHRTVVGEAARRRPR